MKNLIAGCMLALLAAGPTSVITASQSGAKEEAGKAGGAVKEAGKDTADAAKHAGKATAKGTKKAGNEVKKTVTGDAHANCADGTRQAGETEAAAAAACTTHGVVAAKK